MVVEIQTFRLAAGADEAAFLAADQRLQAELMVSAPGFVRRTTARDEQGGWAVVQLWASDRHAADAARWADGSHPALAGFRRLLDPASLQVRRYTTLD